MIGVDYIEKRAISEGDRIRFKTDGFVHLKGLFSHDQIAEVGEAVEEAGRESADPMVRDSDRPDRWIWPRSAIVENFIFNMGVGTLAAELLETTSTRLIHDVFFRRTGAVKGTPWHRDSDFWEFRNGSALTIWIPLQSTPATMALQYVPGSHLMPDLRLLKRFEKALVPLRHRVVRFDMALGDVAIHHYRTLHSSSHYHEPLLRRALAIHTIDADARFSEPKNIYQRDHNSRCGWDVLREGNSFPDHLAPILQPQSIKSPRLAEILHLGRLRSRIES